jgi:hypothetical protein
MVWRLVGPVGQSSSRDEDGHRIYNITWKLETEDQLDGPAVLYQNWPLPIVGSPYSLDNDYDPWAFCTPELTIAPAPDITEGDPIQAIHVTQTWTTKPMNRCNDQEIENPLLEPYQISGDFVHEQKEASVDRFGEALLHPNFQPITGPLVETKHSYPSISFTFNIPVLPLSTYVLLINNVNDSPLWGLPARCIRFIDAKWERVLYGVCYYYYRATYTFEFNIEGFDPKIPASGSTYLRDGGDPNNPADFIPAQANGENVEVLLTQEGRLAERVEDQFIQTRQIAKQGNLLLLGIPFTL